MNVHVKNLGSVLKARREERQLSLKEVENSTSIRMGYLEAIEEGSITKFIAGVYALGFIKQYVSFLELNIDELMNTYPEAFRFGKEKHEFAYGIGTLEVRGTSGGGVKWLPNFLWVLGVGSIVLGIWYLAKYFGLF